MNEGLYEVGDRFGTYGSVGPSTETSRGTTPVFQTPHTRGSPNQETKEDLQIVGLFQYVANYSKQMEKTQIELSRLELMCENNETKMQELESKVVAAQQEVLGLHNHIHATEVQIKKKL